MARLPAKTPRSQSRIQTPRTEAELQRARAILDAVDENQSRLAQELHDRLCQSLSGLRLSAAALRRKSGELDGRAADEFRHLEEVVAKAVGELHDVLQTLQAVEVSPADLTMALEELSRDIKAPGVDCQFRASGRPVVANGFTASQVLRIARAALKHALSQEGSQKLLLEWEEGTNESILSVLAEQPAFLAPESSIERLLGWKLLLRRASAIGATVRVEKNGTGMRLTVPAVPTQAGQ